jgi:hypothetical protein
MLDLEVAAPTKRTSRLLGKHKLSLQILVVIAPLVACGYSTRHAGFDIRILEDTVTLRRTAEVTSFVATAVIRNNSTRVLRWLECSHEAQREIDGQWVAVWHPVCANGLIFAVAPGDSVIFPVTAYGFTHPAMSPPLDPRMGAGRYRLVFPLRLEGDTMSKRAGGQGRCCASPSFTVREPVLR